MIMWVFSGISSILSLGLGFFLGNGVSSMVQLARWGAAIFAGYLFAKWKKWI